MKLELNFDKKEIVILDSEPIFKVIQLLQELGIKEDWKIVSKTTIQIVEKTNYQQPAIPVYPNLPYSPDYTPINPNKVTC